ncbi:MAG: carboxypeptidase regulatory-like domain-containing protein [Bacteroidales bacterium]|nr:carboxypeptidase regulatory-like domain-containing protein [Bacteroidales bacterium]MDX9926292.1 M14 family zinc carboxypeptidase [Bacteroidales bacterium]HNX83873.1 M14 family zinc carboxypeptidase [Bacteroidales bacterium]HPS97313.1 M14 family zinc carboxypeptidase [Bacteroidales bacterium]
MKLRSVIPVLLLLVSMQAVCGQESPAGDDIRNAVSRYGQAEVMISYPGYDAMTRLAARFSVSSCDGLTALLSLSSRDVAEFIAEAIPYRLIVPEERKGFYTASSVAEAMLWQSYPTWKHYDTIMHKIAGHWPDLCRLDTIGFSVQGRAVLALKISDNPEEDEPEPEVMISSSIHGDETAGFVLLMRLAEYLASGGGGAPGSGLASELVSELEIWINPLANPDGMYRNGDTLTYPVRANSNGYDLNRNFPDPEVGTPPPLQKETLDMIRFMEERRFTLSANLHSGAEVVNYPWDKWTRDHADDDWFNAISRRYADTVHLHSESGYMTFLDNGVTKGWKWYLVRGGRQDYVTWGLGGREVTIELDDTKMTPGSNLELMWEWNHRSLLRYIAGAMTGVRGTVTDAETGDPLSAKIFIAGHDRDSSHVWSDTTTGFYTRLLPPGTWNLTFSCPGYKPYTLTADLTSSVPLQVSNIQLEKGNHDYPDPPESGLLVFPNPSDGNFSIMPPVAVTGEVTITVTSTSGALMKHYTTTAQPGIPVECKFTGLPAGIFIISVSREPNGPMVRGKAVITRLINR